MASQLAEMLNCDLGQAEEALEAAGGDTNEATELILGEGIIPPTGPAATDATSSCSSTTISSSAAVSFAANFDSAGGDGFDDAGFEASFPAAEAAPPPPTDAERQAYSSVFEQAARGRPTVRRAEAEPVFAKAQTSGEDVERIWSLCVATRGPSLDFLPPDELTAAEFGAALHLAVALFGGLLPGGLPSRMPPGLLPPAPQEAPSHEATAFAAFDGDVEPGGFGGEGFDGGGDGFCDGFATTPDGFGGGSGFDATGFDASAKDGCGDGGVDAAAPDGLDAARFDAVEGGGFEGGEWGGEPISSPTADSEPPLTSNSLATRSARGFSPDPSFDPPSRAGGAASDFDSPGLSRVVAAEPPPPAREDAAEVDWWESERQSASRAAASDSGDEWWQNGADGRAEAAGDESGEDWWSGEASEGGVAHATPTAPPVYLGRVPPTHPALQRARSSGGRMPLGMPVPAVQEDDPQSVPPASPSDSAEDGDLDWLGV